MADNAPSIPIAETLDQAWRDVLGVVQELTVPSLVALSIATLLGVAGDLLPEANEELGLVQRLWEPLSWALLLYLVAPLLIAAHRFLLRGETTKGYSLAPTPRLTRFYGWSLGLTMVLGVPYVVLFSGLDTGERLFMTLLLLVAFIALLSRLLLLFPAIALDAPGANSTGAWNDSRGDWLAIFVILFEAALQMAAVAGVFMICGAIFFTGFAVPPRGTFSIFSVVYSLFGGAIILLTYVMAVCIAARLYERVGDRLKQAALASKPQEKPQDSTGSSVASG
jgi:hypothetical protein